MEIRVERQPSQELLNQLRVFSWGIWTKEVSEFPWTYGAQETCYFLEGEAVVTTTDGQSVQVGKGDLVTFPAGITCTWVIKSDVKKHYQFD